MTRRETGILGEHVARDYLEEKGYRILETNYHCREGEIDIVARQQDTLIFVEVRTKTGNQFGTPVESVTERKCEKLRLAAEHYGQDHEGLPETWRIDFIGVRLARNLKVIRIDHIENAVEGA